jgi:SAM-dependent methyltransferase
MTAIATARAAERGLGNVTGRVLDLEEIDEPDDAYDVVLCREGLMLVPDPARAAREIARVLRPGGRAVLTVWGPRARNPWLAVVFDVVGTQLGAPMPPPGIPHPFSLDDPDRLGRLLTDARLSDVEVGELETPYLAASADEWWERTCALAGPLARRLAALPDAAARALRARAREAVAEYETPAGLEIPGVSLIASARA